MIFSLSNRFDCEGIEDFIECLSKVCSNELAIEGTPRMFGLQRIAEVAEFNMNRVRFEWNKIWSKLSEFF